MRKAMICVSFMLAVVQLWPMLFGSKSVSEVATPSAQAAVVIPVPRRVAAVTTVPAPTLIKASTFEASAPSSCFTRYRAAFAACAKGDTTCGSTASNRWDLCEATGFWPE